MQKVNFRTHPKTIHVLWLLFASNPVYMHHPTEVQTTVCMGNSKIVHEASEFPEIDRLHMDWEVGHWCAEGWYGCDAFTWTDEFEGTYLATLQDIAGVDDSIAWEWALAWVYRVMLKRIETASCKPNDEQFAVMCWCANTMVQYEIDKEIFALDMALTRSLFD